MIVTTLTPNPSLDRTIEIERLVRGAVIRADATRLEAGGKGVNVARGLVANGHRARAVMPLGGAEGEQFLELLGADGIDPLRIPIAAPVRTNITVVEPDGTVTKLNSPGPPLTGTDVDRLVEETVSAALQTAWLAACGSLPPGAPDRLYADLVAEVDGRSAVAVDASGAALTLAVDAGPDLVKPNRGELAELIGRSLTTVGAVIDAAEHLRARGVGAVLASLGPDGAVLVDDEGAWHARTPPFTPRSTVGAGDATLAGFLAAGGRGPKSLTVAVAWGAAAARLPGTTMPGPDDLTLDEVVLHDPPDPDRPLEGGNT